MKCEMEMSPDDGRARVGVGRSVLKNHLLKPGGRLLITDLSFGKLLIEKISLKYKNGWSLLIFLELSWVENCVEESPFKTWWKVVDDWSSFVKFPKEMKTYILNIRMVVHDWERKEYKNLLNFFSVVKYKQLNIVNMCV